MSELVYYIICSILTAGVLGGIAMMSKVQSSVKGNALSALCVFAAIILTLYKYNLLSEYMLWICMIIGLAVGLIGAYRIKMIQMPETVALLNGFGGAASALVAAISIFNEQEPGLFYLFAAGLALSIGTVTLTGSLIAGGKLHKLLPQKPVIWKKHQAATTIGILLAAVSIPALTLVPSGSIEMFALIAACTLFSGFFGFAFAIRVGGADMPITISLLNSLSGIAGAIAGMAVSEPLLVAIGGVVGASGLLLTQIMCRAMNRSLTDILLGKTSAVPKPVNSGKGDTGNAVNLEEAACSQESPYPDMKALQKEADLQVATIFDEATSEQKDNPAQILSEAKKVIIVPGYGMAQAQAQTLVRQLADKLEAKGAEVLFAIHPVAGRMPGHMNVLLCEVDIPYEKLYEMDEINPRFADCDAAVIIGANDVVNPAANTAEGTPIYGMPVLNAEKAKHLIICNYDLKPGYAGVENPLYSRSKGVNLLLGDAKETLAGLLKNI